MSQNENENRSPPPHASDQSAQQLWLSLQNRLSKELLQTLETGLRALAAIRVARGFILGGVLFALFMLGLRIFIDTSRGRPLPRALFYHPTLWPIITILIFALVLLGLISRRRSHNLTGLLQHAQIEETTISSILHAAASGRLEFYSATTAPEPALTTGPVWWRVELSGLHFLLLLFFFITLFGALLPGFFSFPLMVFFMLSTIIGLTLKAGYWSLWLFASPATRRLLRRLYLYAGTLEGAMDILAIFAGLFLLFAFIFIMLNRLFG